MTEDEIRTLLTNSPTVAVVGMSRNPGKAAHAIPQVLLDSGFTVIPVNPYASEILGQKAYPTLADVPVPVDMVNVFRPSADAAEVARQAAEIGASSLWLQQGVVSEEAAQIASDNDMAYVEDRCLGVAVRVLQVFHAK